MPTQTQKINIAFFGTPALTTTILDELVLAGYTPKVIITNPDRPQGRKMLLTKTPAKLWAEAHNIPVLQPEKIDALFLEKLREINWDIFIVVAYGKILPEELITMPAHGTLNVHYSLLPKYRGATPVESAILHGDTETGVTIQQMVYTLDAGAIHTQEQVSIHATEKAHELRTRLNDLGKVLLVQTVTNILTGSANPKTQDHTLATKCGKIKKEDGLIDPLGDPILNDRKFRAYFGWPGVYFFTEYHGKNARVIVKDAELINGVWVIKRVLPEGGKEISYTEFLSKK